MNTRNSEKVILGWLALVLALTLLMGTPRKPASHTVLIKDRATGEIIRRFDDGNCRKELREAANVITISCHNNGRETTHIIRLEPNQEIIERNK